MAATITLAPIALGSTPSLDSLPGSGHQAWNTLWLVPTSAHRQSLVEAFGSGTPGRILPRILDPEALTNRVLAGAPRADDAFDRAILRQAVREALHAAREPASALTAAEASYHELKQAGVTARVLRTLDEPCPVRDVYQHVESCRTRLRLAGPAERQRQAQELWQEGQRGPFAAIEHVALWGWPHLNGLTLAWCQVFAETVETLTVFAPEIPGGNGSEISGNSREVASQLSEFCRAPLEQNQASLPFPVRPAGVQHLCNHLFRKATPGQDATGLSILEAPGTVGEARIVARHLRGLIDAGCPPDRIVLTARHLDPLLPILHETLEEYSVPHDGRPPEPFSRHPVMRVALAAWRLLPQNFPFAGVTAVLRNTLIHPRHADVRKNPHLPLRAETLLRQLGEREGQAGYLAAVEVWAETPPQLLEDEYASAGHRERLHTLAMECRAFVEWFFRLWEHVPPKATAAVYLEHFERFVHDLGLPVAREAAPFWAVLQRWAQTLSPRLGADRVLHPEEFARQIETLAGGVEMPAPPPRGGVRLLPVEAARGADCDHLLILGLCEGSFPQLAIGPSQLTDQQRTHLRGQGVPLADPAQRRDDERALFLELVARPRQTLTLSYPAVDEKGQDLLPSSFLLAVRDCFADRVIPVTQQRMLIEGFDTQAPRSPAEYRIRMVHDCARSRAGLPELVDGEDTAPAVWANLRAAQVVARDRFREITHTCHEGVLRRPAVLADLASRLSAEQTLSPTALETYVACPFRFWLQQVLRLQPLEEPGEEVEHTRRGAVVHRALAAYHKQVLAPDDTTSMLATHIDHAVQQYAERAPSQASRVLWELEGRRLMRPLARYQRQWQDFIQPWVKQSLTPKPFALEATFGLKTPPEGQPSQPPLVISRDGIEVRIGGTIDRVDAAEHPSGTVFWILDYKSGRGASYTAKAFERMEKLQLTLYALAAERVLFAKPTARPLAMAYWMVMDKGPKWMLPGTKKSQTWLEDPSGWPRYREHLEQWVVTLVRHMRAGDFPLAPRSEDCTATCSYGSVCRITQSRAVGKHWHLELPVIAGPDANPEAAD